MLLKGKNCNNIIDVTTLDIILLLNGFDTPMFGIIHNWPLQPFQSGLLT